MYLDIDETLISKRVHFSKKGYKYAIGQKDDDDDDDDVTNPHIYNI